MSLTEKGRRSVAPADERRQRAQRQPWTGTTGRASWRRLRSGTPGAALVAGSAPSDPEPPEAVGARC